MKTAIITIVDTKDTDFSDEEGHPVVAVTTEVFRVEFLGELKMDLDGDNSVVRLTRIVSAEQLKGESEQ